MFIEVLFAVVVGELLPFFDAAQGTDVDMAARAIGLAVGCAGMIDETRFVGRDVAVDHKVAANPKKIFPGVSLLLRLTNLPTRILDDAHIFGYGLFGKEPFASF